MDFSLVREYLKNILGDEYYVTNERNLEYQKDKINVVINFLAGTEFDGTMLIPVQMFFYSNDIDETQDKLNTFVAEYNQKTWNAGENFIRNEFTSAQCLDKNVADISINESVEFFIGGTFLIYKDIVRLIKIKVDGVDHNVINYNFSHSSVADSTDNFDETSSDKYLIESTNGFVSQVLSVVLYSKDTDFLNTCLKMNMGEINPNTVFDAQYYFSNGLSFDKKVICTKYSNLTETTNDIPKVQLELTRASSLLEN